MMNAATINRSRAWPRDNDVQRGNVRRLGLWMYLATVTMLFAAFISAYIVRKSGSDWQRIALPSQLWWNTGVIIASSLVLEAASWFGSRARWRASLTLMMLSLALGLGFVAGQLVAWNELVTAGVYLPTNPFSSFFFMITGAHAVHVVAALCVLVWAAIATGRQMWRPADLWRPASAGRTPQPDQERWNTTMGICRTFWHFLGGVWLTVFLFVSVY